MILEGKILKMIGVREGTSQTSGKEWKLATYLLETGGQYSKQVAVDVFGNERIDEFSLIPDEVVKLEIDVESREFNGKWYTSVRAYKKHEVYSYADAAIVKDAERPVTNTSEDDVLPF